jgi:hypothetical protein
MTKSPNDRDRGEGEPDLAEMRALENALGELPTEARVPDHLWAGVRERMVVPETDVLVLETRRAGVRRRFSLSLGQLVAAGLALALASGAGVWMALSDATGPGGIGVETSPAVPGGLVAMDRGGVTTTTVQEYESAVSELEAVLADGRAVLGDETIATIEASLAAIDAAIEEAAEALARDPGSDVLNRMMARSMWKKIEILKQTAVAIRGRST